MWFTVDQKADLTRLNFGFEVIVKGSVRLATTSGTVRLLVENDTRCLDDARYICFLNTMTVALGLPEMHVEFPVSIFISQCRVSK